MAQRIVDGVIEHLQVIDGGPSISLVYRRAGLAHMMGAGMGLEPRGRLTVDPREVRIAETSRSRWFSRAIPTRSVRSVTLELNRRWQLLVGAAVWALLGATVIAFAIADRTDAGWWPELERASDPMILGVIGAVGVAIAVVNILVYAFHKTIDLGFDAGGGSETTLRLRRSWKLSLNIESVLAMLARVERIVLGAPPPPMV